MPPQTAPSQTLQSDPDAVIRLTQIEARSTQHAHQLVAAMLAIVLAAALSATALVLAPTPNPTDIAPSAVDVEDATPVITPTESSTDNEHGHPR